MTQTEALKLADALNELLESFEKDGRFCKSSSIRNELYNRLKQTLEESKEDLAQPEQERCVGCEACIDTACGRDECPKGWPKAAQPEQEPVTYIRKDQLQKAKQAAFLCEVTPEPRQDRVGIHTTPPQRKPLTDEEVRVLYKVSTGFDFHGGSALTAFIRAIEAAHGIKE